MSVDLFENKDAWKSLDTKALMDIIPNYFEFSGVAKCCLADLTLIKYFIHSNFHARNPV